MNSDGCVEHLTGLGLTMLEAEIYVYLLQHSPASGYKIAKAIGRSFPSTYKAVVSLQAKGAVLVDDGRSRLSRAVPVGELMDQLETRFHQQRSAAVTALDRLPKSPADTRIYQLTSIDQVYERGRRLLAECEERALLELFPEPLARLRESIEQTAARGVDLTARVYERTTLRHVRLIHSPFGEQDLRMFKTQWLALLIDGRQFLLAHLLRGGAGVMSATSSANPAVARALYDHANSDFHHYAFRPFLETANSVPELRAAYERLAEVFPPAGDLGFKDLLEEFSGESPEDAEGVGASEGSGA
jgi:hypothetical protein